MGIYYLANRHSVVHVLCGKKEIAQMDLIHGSRTFDKVRLIMLPIAIVVAMVMFVSGWSKGGTKQAKPYPQSCPYEAPAEKEAHVLVFDAGKSFESSNILYCKKNFLLPNQLFCSHSPE